MKPATKRTLSVATALGLAVPFCECLLDVGHLDRAWPEALLYGEYFLWPTRFWLLAAGNYPQPEGHWREIIELYIFSVAVNVLLYVGVGFAVLGLARLIRRLMRFRSSPAENA